MQIYLVGGAVRDELLNLHIIEKDWVVVGSSESEMLAKGFKKVGKDFPVFLHPKTGEEYALARTERKSGQGYHGFEVDTANVTLEEDLSRRDLTVNAIAKSIDNQELIDPIGGIKDLKNKILRHISQAFCEDPLRVLRVARFYARFYYLDFIVAEETKGLLKRIAQSGELDALTPERVWQETARALMEKNPERYFQLLLETQCMTALFPELLDELSKPDNIVFKCLMQAEQHQLPLESRYALCSFGSDADSLSERIKVPNHIAKLANLTNSYYPVLTAESLNAEALNQCFKQTQAYKKPAVFRQLMQIIMIISQQLNPKLHKIIGFSEAINAGLAAATAIESKTFIEQGFSGVELGQKIEDARIQAIATYINIKEPS